MRGRSTKIAPHRRIDSRIALLTTYWIGQSPKRDGGAWIGLQSCMAQPGVTYVRTGLCKIENIYVFRELFSAMYLVISSNELTGRNGAHSKL